MSKNPKMTVLQALDVLETGVDAFDCAVTYQGMFGAIWQYEKAKNARREYKVAVRIIRSALPNATVHKE